MTLELIRAPAAWRARLDACRATGQRVGLVPTMGALHAGHLSLIRRAAADCDVAAVTDYVNPLQFGPAEDLGAYPRHLDDDCRLAGEVGRPLGVRPDDRATLARAAPHHGCAFRASPRPWRGRRGPGHFDGVATIVAKLLALAGPCWAYFGEKDFQQLAVIRRLVADLSLPVEVFGCPIVRDPDGLALSSRNAYLTAGGASSGSPASTTPCWPASEPSRTTGPPTPPLVSMVMAEALAREPRSSVSTTPRWPTLST